MSNKNKKLAMWGFYLLIGVLLAFAASRTLHFVQTVMSNAMQGYMFLFATGLGAIIWLYVYLQWAEGSTQRAISFAMGLIDLVGELVLTYADMQYVGSEHGALKMTADEMNVFFAISVLIVGANIFAGWMFKISDLKAQQDQQAQDLVDHVTEETMRSLNTPDSKAQMVQELLPVLKSSIASRVAAEIHMRAGQQQLIDPASVGLNIIPPAPQQKEQAVPFLSGLLGKFGIGKQDNGPAVNENMAWTVDAKGNRHRIICMVCQAEGKPWMTPEPCDHILNATGESGGIEAVAKVLKSGLPENAAQG